MSTVVTALPTGQHNVTKEDFKLDLSKGVKGTQQDSSVTDNKFESLCDNLQCCLRNHLDSLNTLYDFKDELLKYSLPSHLLLQLTLLSSQIHRNSSDLNILTNEMIRLVRQYSVPWEEKGTVLRKLKTDYENKQRQTSIAVRQLELLAVKAEKIEHERRLNNWMKLYSKVMSANSIGRRWKFRIAPFKKKIAEGYNPYGSDDESDSEDSEDELFDRHKTSSTGGSDEELRELASELSQALASQQNTGIPLKGLQFTGFEETPLSIEGSVSPVLPKVTTVDVETWTEEPEYDHHLLVSLCRPRDMLEGVDICCTVTIGDEFFTSQIFAPNEDDKDKYESFHFTLPEDIATFLSPLLPPSLSNSDNDDDNLDMMTAPKLSIAVFPQSIDNEMIAMCSIPLPDLTLLGDYKIIKPPDSIDSSDHSVTWSLDWTSLCNDVSGPARYELKLVGEGGNELRGRGEEPYLLVESQWVRVLRHKVLHTATGTQEWEELVESMGYKKGNDTESRAVSAMTLVSSRPSTPAITPEDEADYVKMTAEEMAELTMKHAQELKELQQEYEKKLERLSRELTKMATEKQKQIEKLEEVQLVALVESNEANKSIKRPSEIRKIMAKKKRVSFSKVDWGKRWPDNFYERLDLFTHDSLQRQAQLTERIKQEVHDTCERQLAALHRLAPLVASASAALNDVCLPALFMPLPSTRPLIFNPRAHNYFHPSGSTERRVTQPPSVFKLPPLFSQKKSGVTTIDVTQDADRYWRQVHPSPSLTPAPPPSACDNYPTNNNGRPVN